MRWQRQVLLHLGEISQREASSTSSQIAGRRQVVVYRIDAGDRRRCHRKCLSEIEPAPTSPRVHAGWPCNRGSSSTSRLRLARAQCRG
jgi:hypothetical protein